MGLNGTFIASDLPISGSYDWNTSEMPEGDYWVYGRLENVVYSALDYSSGPVTINHPYYSCPYLFTLRKGWLLSAFHSKNGVVMEKLRKVDGDYTKLERGDGLDLAFSAPDPRDGLIRDFALVSTGYYIAEPGGIQSGPAEGPPKKFGPLITTKKITLIR